MPRGLSVTVSFRVRVDRDAPVGGEIENLASITDALGRAYEARAIVPVAESGN